MFLSAVVLTLLPISTLAYPSSRFSRRQATEDNPDIQNSLTLDASVIATGFANNGQAVAEPGQVASLTSNNNFINFCATVPQLPITNGKQITTGSCNPAPMGSIPASSNMPSAKFVFPTNMGTVQANTNFTIQLAITGMQTGFFVNAQQNYFAAPQQLNDQGQIIGHSHVVIEALDSLTSTTPSDPTKFSFFKGLNAAAQGGILTATASLPSGVYKISTINTAANHQPVLGPIAQHGSFDDVVYFTVTDDGNAAAGSGGGAAASGGGNDGGAAATASAANDAGAASATGAPAAASTTPANGGPAFDPAGAQNVGNGKGTQFIGGQCLSGADCASGCCAGPSGICSGLGAQTQAGKTGCGFSSTAPAPANGASADAATATDAQDATATTAAAGNGGGKGKGGRKGGKGGGKKGQQQQRRNRLELLRY